MRIYESKITITCDRCGKKTTFQTENPEDSKEYLKWQTLGTGGFMPIFGGKSFDLCPECFITIVLTKRLFPTGGSTPSSGII